jgi:hypothetical protein
MSAAQRLVYAAEAIVELLRCANVEELSQAELDELEECARALRAFCGVARP